MFGASGTDEIKGSRSLFHGRLPDCRQAVRLCRRNVIESDNRQVFGHPQAKVGSNALAAGSGPA